MPYVTARDGCRLHFTDHGRGKPVVLVQGLGLSGRFWFDLPETLASDYRVIVPDNRGTGRSEPSRRPFMMRTLGDDIASVLDACEVDSAYVAGISMGGMIAQHFAIRHPQRARGLVLMATTPGLPHGRIPPLKSLLTLLSMPARINGDAEAALPLAKLLVPEMHWGRAAELFSGWEAAISESPLNPIAFVHQFAAITAHSTGRDLKKITCPTAIITGDSDRIVPPFNAHVLAKGIPHATLEVLKDVGHAIPTLDKGVVARALLRLVEQSRMTRAA